MTWIASMAFLLIGTTGLMPDHVEQHSARDFTNILDVKASRNVFASIEAQNADRAPRRSEPATNGETQAQTDAFATAIDQTSIPLVEADVDVSSETNSEVETTETEKLTDGELTNASYESKNKSLSTSKAEEPLTLDELLRQAKQTPHLQQEALLARLAQRRRLALALRTTLEAASQVAEFGEAGAELLRDASLDKIVATMIADQEQEAQSQSAPSAEAQSASSDKAPLNDIAVPNPREFDAWQPVFIVHDARGHRVGWRHRSNGERVTTYVGKTMFFGDDSVTIVSVSIDERGRSLIVDVNGERRDVPIF